MVKVQELGQTHFGNNANIKRQNNFFPQVKEETDKNDKLMVFLFPPTDTVSGGLMSLANIAAQSKEYRDTHGYSVVVSTIPGKLTISGFSGFACDLQILRFPQIIELAKNKTEIFFQVPEMSLEAFNRYLRQNKQWLASFADTRLNIINQNIDLMPPEQIIHELASNFKYTTQTCAHLKYCTAKNADKYGMPLHHLPADYPIQYYSAPYSDKQNIIAYSNDTHPQKDVIMEKLRKFLPNYQHIIIQGLPFDDYKKLISRAKWTVTFGEGWDGYFIQPYFSNSIGICVFNEAFCPPVMRQLPTVFETYDTFAEDIRDFIVANDNEESYNAMIAQVKNTLFPPYVGAPLPVPLLEFYKGNYTIPRQGREMA